MVQGVSGVAVVCPRAAVQGASAKPATNADAAATPVTAAPGLLFLPLADVISDAATQAPRASFQMLR